MDKVFIGIPILNRLDLLRRCVASIDYPAEIVIVNNNSVDSTFNGEIRRFAQERGIELLHQERNLGVSASFNLLIRTGFERGFDWLFIGSNDTFLKSGSIEAAVRIPKEPDVAIYQLFLFCFFMTSRKTAAEVGWWDENFYPAYEEDIDYAYRCKLAGLRCASVPNAGAEHIGSATIHSNPHYLAQNKETHHRWNREYYRQKWGGDGGSEQFIVPFNDRRYDLRWWPEPSADVSDRDWDNLYRTGSGSGE